MAFFPTATIANERSQNNIVIASEIYILVMSILTAITQNKTTVTYAYDSTVTINGTQITGSVMTNDDVTGQLYYSVWSGTTDGDVETENMNEVMKFFDDNKYAISRVQNTDTENTFNWVISWK